MIYYEKKVFEKWMTWRLTLPVAMSAKLAVQPSSFCEYYSEAVITIQTHNLSIPERKSNPHQQIVHDDVLYACSPDAEITTSGLVAEGPFVTFPVFFKSIVHTASLSASSLMRNSKIPLTYTLGMDNNMLMASPQPNSVDEDQHTFLICCSRALSFASKTDPMAAMISEDYTRGHRFNRASEANKSQTHQPIEVSNKTDKRPCTQPT